QSPFSLQEIRERFTRVPDQQSLLLWLYRCWFAGANVDIFLDTSEARQLGPLAQDVAVDRGIWRRAGTHSLWRRLAWSVREAHTERELLARRDRWNSEVEGVEYLTELTMADILFGHTRNSRFLDDPDGAYCTWHIWEAFVSGAPPPYAEALASLTWDGELKVLKLKNFIWNCTPKPSSPPRDGFSSVETRRGEHAASGDDPCAICHEELGGMPCELQCGHEFHRECIRMWLQESSSTCPICRDYAVLPADVPERPARSGAKCYGAKAWKRSVF
ncbi:DZIP3 ligase, partial [Bombycilla garrulus]|nr:DZIP3 ligase [Bombycilla garrulus]